MSLRDDLLATVEDVRRIPAQEGMGVYVTSVYLRTETYAAAIKDGVALSSSNETEIVPTPKVQKLSAEKAAFYGGGVMTDSNGALVAGTYRVGPITPNPTEGGGSGVGYALTDLLPTGATTAVRKLLRLSGPDFQSNGEVCEIIDVDATRPFRIMLTVRRAGTVT